MRVRIGHGWIDTQTDVQMDGQTDGWIDRQTELTDRCTNKQLGRQTDGQTDGRIVRQMYEYTKGWINIRSEGQTYKQNEQTNI